MNKKYKHLKDLTNEQLLGEHKFTTGRIDKLKGDFSTLFQAGNIAGAACVHRHIAPAHDFLMAVEKELLRRHAMV